MKRSGFLAAASAAAIVPRAAQAQTLTPVRIAGTPQMSVSAALYAQASSAFQKNGIDASIVPMNSGAAIIAAMMGGSLDICNLSMLNLIEAHARNLPLVVECAASLYSADTRDSIGLIVAKDSPIRSGRNMNGKIMAVAALGDTFTIAASTWIDKTGGDSSTVKFIEIPNAAAAEAIAAGRANAAILVQPTLRNAVAGGKVRTIADPFAAIAPRFISTVYACTTDYAAKNAAIVATFRKVIADAGLYVNGHVPEVLPIMAKFSAVDIAVLANLPFTRMGDPAALKDSRAMIQPLIDAAAKYKVIPRPFDARDFIDPAALT